MQVKPCLVIWNPRAGSADQARAVRKELQSRPEIAFRESSSEAEARQLASGAASEGRRRVVAAGGDGAVHAVINGLLEQDQRPELGILPLGTGNDLCRSLGIPLAPAEAARLIIKDCLAPRLIDLVRVEGHGELTFFANVCSGGNSRRVRDSLTADMKRHWGAWSYLRGAIDVLRHLNGVRVVVKLGEEPDESYNLWNVVIANGRTVAGGVSVAPNADICDGLLDLILIRDGTLLDVAALSANFFLGNYLEDERVVYRRTQSVEFQSNPPMEFVADGEVVATTPVRFAIEPRALPILAGPPAKG